MSEITNEVKLIRFKKTISSIVCNYLNEDLDYNKEEIISTLNKLTKNEQFYDSYKNGVKVKVKLIYIRFGLPRVDDQGKIVSSIRHVFGQEISSEEGVSVFEVGWDGTNVIFEKQGSALNSAFDELMYQNRKIYVLSGEISNTEGSDGELLMIPNTVKVILELPKNIIVIS